MDRYEFKQLTEKIYNNIIDYYGISRYHNTSPYIGIEDSPFSDEDVSSATYGEYCFMMNEIVLYWKNISSTEMLSRTLIHEYQHHLQSPRWMKRYYSMGYDYKTHPYEIAALAAEESWQKFI